MAVDSPPLAEGRRPAAQTPGSGSSGPGWHRRPGGQRRIELHLKPVQTPVQVWAGGPSLHADKADGVASLHRVTYFRLQRALMKIDGEYAVAVVQHRRAPGEKEVGFRKNH